MSIPITPDPALKDWLAHVVDDEEKGLTTPLVVDQVPYPVCGPHTLLIDAKAKTIVCSRCGRGFDAFEALLYISKNWKRYAENLAAIRTEIAQLAKKRELVRKQVQSLKAMAKRRTPGV